MTTSGTGPASATAALMANGSLATRVTASRSPAAVEVDPDVLSFHRGLPSSVEDWLVRSPSVLDTRPSRGAEAPLLHRISSVLAGRRYEPRRLERCFDARTRCLASSNKTHKVRVINDSTGLLDEFDCRPRP